MNLTRLINQLKIDEGFRSHTYQDSLGVWTIGYGTTFVLTPMGKQYVQPNWQVIDKVQAEYWLCAHISLALHQSKQFVNNFSKLCDEQQESIINMAYQLGSRLLNFKKAKYAIEHGQNDVAYRELLDSKWAKQTPKRAQRVALAFLDHEIKI